MLDYCRSTSDKVYLQLFVYRSVAAEINCVVNYANYDVFWYTAV
jgi:hypothetical protein